MNNKKTYDKLAVWTFSGSGWGTIKEKPREKVPGSLQCNAVQEHHLTEEKWPVVTQSVRAQGCQQGVPRRCRQLGQEVRWARLLE